MNPSASYAIDLTGEVCFPGGAAGGYGIIVSDNMFHYVLGLLNSKLVDFYLKKISTNFRGGWFAYDAKPLRRLPILSISSSDKVNLTKRDRIVELVTDILDSNKRFIEAKTDQEKVFIQRQIDGTDREIDKLVYELYGLTEDEIKIVEGEN